MKPEQQRIAIAEACGWSGPFGMFSHCASGKQLLTSRSDTLHGTPPKNKGKPEDECSYKPVPDYLNDLNAMHEAEKVLSNEQAFTMREHAWRIASFKDGKCGHASRDEQGRNCYNATATQRAEAFLRTLNLWKP